MDFTLLEKETDEVKKFNNIDWAKSYRQASPEEKDKIIDNFIEQFLQTHNINSGIGFQKALHNLIKMFGDSGFIEEFNPFLDWMVKYDKAVGNLNQINDQQFGYLRDLYGDGVLLEKDINATSSLKTKSVIFNKDLYTRPKNEFTYLVKVFYYLNSAGGRDAVMNKIKGLESKQKYEFAQRLDADFSLFFTDKIYKDESQVKYYMVFADNKYSSQGKLRNPETINSAISYLDTKVADKEDRSIRGKDDKSYISPEFNKRIEQAKSKIAETGNIKKSIVDRLFNVITAKDMYELYEDSSVDALVEVVTKMARTLSSRGAQ